MHFVYVWEMGSGYAHLTLGIPILTELIARGHRVSLVVADPKKALEVAGRLNVKIYQSPLWSRCCESVSHPRSYAQILKAQGFCCASELDKQLANWEALFDLLLPDYLLFDHSPTGMVAATGRPIHQAVFGHGFLIPPCTSPISPYWIDATTVNGKWIADEFAVLAAINHALTRRKTPPLSSLSALFSSCEQFLTTWEELDCYSRLGVPQYWGPIPPPRGEMSCTWPSAAGRRIFVYSRLTADGTVSLLNVLRQTDHAYLVALPKGVHRRIRESRTSNISLCSNFIDVEDVIHVSDAVMSHGGIGMTSASLAMGKPSISIPLQMEQLLLAKRVEQIGAGRMLHESEIHYGLGPTIAAVTETIAIAAAATQFSRRVGGMASLREQPARIADRLLELS